MGNREFVIVGCQRCGVDVKKRSDALSQNKAGEIRCRACAYKFRYCPPSRPVYDDPTIAPMNERVSKIKQCAGRRGLEFSIPTDVARQIIRMPCHYCGVVRTEMRLHGRRKIPYPLSMNGLDRVDSSKGYHADNVVPCCAQCNSAKGTLSVEEFKAHVEKMHRYLEATRWEIISAV